jgi:class 3 adenylate cyclase
MDAGYLDNHGTGYFKWLSFPFKDKKLESAFSHYFIQDYLKTSRNLMLVINVGFYIFFISDQIIDPNTALENHITRGLIALPAMLFLTFILYIKYFQKFYEIICLLHYSVAQISYCFISLNMENGIQYSPLLFIILLMGANLTFALQLKYTLMIAVIGVTSIIITHGFVQNIDEGWLKSNLNYMLTSIVFSSIAAHMRERAARRKFLTDRAIIEMQEQVDGLLQSLLPDSIAGRMQAGETSIAESHGEVTVIFARISGLSDPQNVTASMRGVRVLNRLFSLFDAESEQYGVEKIKTIGGCYMAIAGLSVKSTGHDHAENAANFALGLCSVIKKWNETYDVNVKFGIGIHVGPIVAGVIGQQQPRFDCWGETVNIASRLESFASESEIYVSESTYWRLKSKFQMSCIGEYSMKGIGQSVIYKLDHHLHEKDN